MTNRVELLLTVNGRQYRGELAAASESLQQMGTAAGTAGKAVEAVGMAAERSAPRKRRLKTEADGASAALGGVATQAGNATRGVDRTAAASDRGAIAQRRLRADVDNTAGALGGVGNRARTVSDIFLANERAAESSAAGFSQLTGLLGSLGLAYSALEVGRFFTGAALGLDAVNTRLVTVFGSQQAANEQFEFAERLSRRLGTSLISTADSYAGFSAATRGTILEGEQTREVFSAVSEAAARLRLSTADTNGVLLALTQIVSKGTVSAEELRGQLGERLPGAFRIAAEAIGVTQAELGKLLEQGAIASDDFLPKFGRALRENFGTSALTEVDSLASGFERLKNEILAAADATSRPVVGAAGQGANYLAELLRYDREGGFVAGVETAFAPLVDPIILANNFVSGQRNQTIGQRARSTNSARSFVAENPFSPQIYNPNAAPAERFFGPGTPAAVNGGLSGERLLAAPGAARVDAGNVAELQREIALLDRRSALERADYEISNGKLKNASEYEKSLARELAARQDALAAEKTARTRLTAEGREALKDAGELSKVEAERAENADKLIVAVQARLSGAEEELDTGRKLTEAGRELARLKAGEYDSVLAGLEPQRELLRIELMKLDTLQQQQASLKDAAQARQQAERAGEAYLRGRRPDFGDRRGLADPDPFGRLDAIRSGQQRQESEAFRAADQANTRAAELDPDNGKEYRRRELELAQAHAEAQIRIDEEYVAARMQVYASIATGTATVFGQVADIAASFGRKGYAVYKAFAIGQALLEIPQIAIAAFKSALAVPVFGPVLAPIAAATAVAAQGIHIANLRRSQPPGRRFGGSVIAGNPYEIDEGGSTEVFRNKSTGRSYLIPGADGEVIPANRAAPAGIAGGGRSEVRLVVDVVNQTRNTQVRVEPVTRSDGFDGLRVLVQEIVVGGIDGDGPINSALLRRGVPRYARTI